MESSGEWDSFMFSLPPLETDSNDADMDKNSMWLCTGTFGIDEAPNVLLRAVQRKLERDVLPNRVLAMLEVISVVSRLRYSCYSQAHMSRLYRDC